MKTATNISPSSPGYKSPGSPSGERKKLRSSSPTTGMSPPQKRLRTSGSESTRRQDKNALRNSPPSPRYTEYSQASLSPPTRESSGYITNRLNQAASEKTENKNTVYVSAVGKANALWKLGKYANNVSRTWLDTNTPIIPLVDSGIGVLRYVGGMREALTLDPDDIHISDTHKEINRVIDVSFANIDLAARLGRSIKIAIFLGGVVGDTADKIGNIANIIGILGLSVAWGKFVYDTIVNAVRQKRATDAVAIIEERITNYETLIASLNAKSGFSNYRFVSAEVKRLQAYAKSEDLKLLRELEIYMDPQDPQQCKYIAPRHLRVLTRLLDECYQDLKEPKRVLAKIKEDSKSNAFKVARLTSIGIAVFFFNLIKITAVAATHASIALPLVGSLIMIFWGLADYGRREAKSEEGKAEFFRMQNWFEEKLQKSNFIKNSPKLKSLITSIAVPFMYVVLGWKASDLMQKIIPIGIGIGVLLLTLSKWAALSSITALPGVGYALIAVMITAFIGRKLAEETEWGKELYSNMQSSFSKTIMTSTFLQEHQQVARVVETIIKPLMHIAIALLAIPHYAIELFNFITNKAAEALDSPSPALATPQKSISTPKLSRSPSTLFGRSGRDSDVELEGVSKNVRRKLVF